MGGYYSDRLAGERLRACYEIAPPRVRAYLESEIDFTLGRISSSATLLELGCGFGRVLDRLAGRVRAATGIDTSRASLRMARRFLADAPRVELIAMDASKMGFRDRAFDVTVCIQNGICAFALDPLALMGEAIRVTRSGGVVLFSSYSARFWPDRLEWFEAQAARGLIGAIDRAATGDGVIVCKDGLRIATLTPDGFVALAARLGVTASITELDGMSLFCELVAP